ncbi:MAG: class I SAM-dependent methyltransferase [Puniceicoccales bacterium]|jgi:ubiquinone/menaquinone biosynthesis C-methylase UbiE|nr:class I SAM-dependent methyltransferase [Puniceicoccales bacterium]
MSALTNVPYFSHPETVLSYARMVGKVGLWRSELLLGERYIPKEARILELGCGAGRIAFGLWQQGWKNITATDFSRPMIEMAHEINKARKTGIIFSVADATQLPFADAEFDAVIFGFNGLMMIPSLASRKKVLREMWRVLCLGGVALFTGHERDTARNAAHWLQESERWEQGKHDPELEIFGDYNHHTPEGKMYIHASQKSETAALVLCCGFEILLSEMRSSIAVENAAVHEFSDDTRFWLIRKNGNSF